MRRRLSARTSNVKASLFPFLAVLICTMGVLIMLLVVIARQSRVDAARATQPTPVDEQDLQGERELVELRIEQLKEQRAQTEKGVSAARLELGHLEDHARRLARQIESLKLSFAALKNTTGRFDQQAAARQLEALQHQIAVARRRLEQAKALHANKHSSYAIIPYRGPNETYRRPIYIECREDAVILQPEGVRLTEDDFRGPLSSANPLAAALRSAREYYARRTEADQAEAGEPYPLLLVRTDGILAYYIARGALKSWGSEFGYELVDNDWQLEFPPPDQSLAEIEKNAVAEARTLQRQLALVAPRKFARASKPVFRVAPGGGGLVRVDGGRAYGGGGFSGKGHRRSTSPRTTAAGARFAGRPATAAAGNPHGTTTATLDDLATIYGRAGQGGAAGGRGGSGTGTGEHSGRQASGLGRGKPSSQPAGAAPNFAAGADGSGKSAAPEPNSSTFDPFAPGMAADRGEAGSRSQAGADGGDQSAGQAGGQAGGTASSGTSGSSASASTAAANAASGGSPSGSQNPDESSTSVGSRPAAARPVESLANLRGADWGLPGSTRGAVPLTRPIRVECRSDRLVFWSDDRRPRPLRTVKLNPRTEESVDELVSAVWEQMDSWGIAGRGLYWRPMLIFEVHPEAAWRYQEIAALLANSGLDLRHRILQAPTAMAPSTPTRR